MVIYRGFSTQFNNLPTPSLNTPGIDGGQGTITRPVVPVKKFSLYDDQLVIVDFLNALNIPQGQKPGKPEYGTTIWSFIFEPNIPEVQIQIENEIRRIAGLDPRLIINTVIIYPYENGFLIEMELAIAPENKVQQLQLNFDRNSGVVTLS
jgi:phage baseplate assembly protein W